MVRLSDLPDEESNYLREIDCPIFRAKPWVVGPSVNDRRVAIVSTAGLQGRGELPFNIGASDYRVISKDTKAKDLMISHISTNFDRSGFEQDINVMFPIDRLNEMSDAGEIGSVGNFHYSFMGATDPRKMEDAARYVARLLKNDGVDACVLIPV